MLPDEPKHESDRNSPISWISSSIRGLILVGVVTALVYLYRNYGESLSLGELATRERELREFQQQHSYLVYIVAFLIYVSVTGLSLPGATVLSLTFAWYFGFWRCLLLVSFASTAGATLAFLLSRFLFRDAILRKFGDRLDGFNKALSRDGVFYLFMLRLMPSVPFFLINVVMGLTPIKTRTYWWVSQLGMLPGTIVYIYAGSRFPDLQTLADRGVKGILSPSLVVAFVLLGLFPLAVRRGMAKVRPQIASDDLV